MISVEERQRIIARRLRIRRACVRKYGLERAAEVYARVLPRFEAEITKAKLQALEARIAV